MFLKLIYLIQRSLYMRLEDELFRFLRPDVKKLEQYGFIKDRNRYEYTKELIDVCMTVIVVVDKGSLYGKVIDNQTRDEYITIHTAGNKGNYATKVRTQYLEVLEDIASHCFYRVTYASDQANSMHEWMTNTLHDICGHPFTKVVNHKRVTAEDVSAYHQQDNNKLYAMMLSISRSKVDGKDDTNLEDIITIKVNPDDIHALLEKDGIYPGYHMNKKHWISIIMDSSVEDKQIQQLIIEARKLVGNHRSVNHTWVIPANPKYFDVDHAFQESDLLYWNQRANYTVGDTLFIYYGKPFSQLRYMCKIVEKDIKFHDKQGNPIDENLYIRIQKMHFFDDGELNRNFIAKYGLTSIRGARSMPKELMMQIAKMYPFLVI